MDQSSVWLASGLVIGIILIWIGILVALISLPMAKGEVHSREYNYRPFQSKYIKSLPDEELDKINRKWAKWVIVWAIIMIAMGIIAMIFGIVNGIGLYLPLIMLVPVILIAIMAIASYIYLLMHKKGKIGRHPKDPI